MSPKIFWIDIAGTCNLRCPSCAVGNFQKSDFAGPVRHVGFMDLAYFQKALRKIKDENPDDVCRIEIYNWGEPLLHPEIAAFIREINKYPKFLCGISSNLSHKHMDLEGALRAEPRTFRISLSGFRASSYSQTHVRGDIELVKANMVRIREIITKYKLKTMVSVAYHVYRHNAGDELEEMRQFCEKLNFVLTPNWANFYPLEKLERYFEGKASAMEKDLIGKLVFSPEEHLEYARPFKNQPCKLQDHTVINHDGSVGLCCATFDPANNIAANFLEVSAPILMDIKYKHPTCDRCIASGYHGMMCGYGMTNKDEHGADRIALADGWAISGNRLIRKEPERV